MQSIINLRGTGLDITWMADIMVYSRNYELRGRDGGRSKEEETGMLSYLVPVCLVRLLRKPWYPEDFGGLQKTAKGTLVHVHLPVIDELHQRVQVTERYILKYYHRVFTRCALQKGMQGRKEETFSRIS